MQAALLNKEYLPAHCRDPHSPKETLPHLAGGLTCLRNQCCTLQEDSLQAGIAF